MTSKKAPQAVSAVMQRLRGQGGAPRALTNSERKFLENSALLQSAAADANDAAYLARELVQASLPHSNPGDVPLWTRRMPWSRTWLTARCPAPRLMEMGLRRAIPQPTNGIHSSSRFSAYSTDRERGFQTIVNTAVERLTGHRCFT